MICEKCGRATALKYCPWCDPFVTELELKGPTLKKPYNQHRRGSMFVKYHGGSSLNRRRRKEAA